MSDFPGAIDYYVDPSRTFIGKNDHKARWEEAIFPTTEGQHNLPPSGHS